MGTWVVDLSQPTKLITIYLLMVVLSKNIVDPPPYPIDKE